MNREQIKEKGRQFGKAAGDKRYFFLWLAPAAILGYILWRWILRQYEPGAGLLDMGYFEPPITAFLFIIAFILFTMWLINFLFNHLIVFFVSNLKETFSQISDPWKKYCVLLFVFFNLYWSFIYITGKIMGSADVSSVLQLAKSVHGN